VRVGVYVDAFNLYYGGRSHFGRGTAEWKWLDMRGLAQSLAGWTGSVVSRIVYCTARVDTSDSPSAATDQDIYLQALRASGSIDVMELGRYVARAKKQALAGSTSGGKPVLFRPPSSLRYDRALPLEIVKDAGGSPMVLATVRNREEKGSDVNVATHLLVDVLNGIVDAAIVISNDSDLALPIRVARGTVPVGVVNPSKNQLAGALRGRPTDGVGRHWWRQLTPADFRAHQLPVQVGSLRRPLGW
jgi:uncharacterized LabA/DUF88 family protein